MASSPLRTIAGHRLIAGLGKGGMAIVYLAVSQKQFGFTKLVVLKILREEMDVDDGFIEMFLQEARLAARLNHPNIVQTYEVGADEGRHYIAMEYLEGQALSAILSRVGPAQLPLEFQLRAICDVLEGLHYAHELTDYDGIPLGIVHRDISPQNVFVTYTGQGKILDFGIAKTSSSSRTAFGIVKGKSGYMAPEQATGGLIDRRADIFAIGVMIWEAIAKRRLVSPKDEELAALKRRISGGDPKIRDEVPDAPPELADICDKAMAIDPKDRYATALELRDALEGFLAGREPWDARRVASVLDVTFADERGRVRRLVDEQTKRLQSGPVDALRRDSTLTSSRSTLTGGGGFSRPVTDVTSMAEESHSSTSAKPTRLARLRGPLVLLGAVAVLGTSAGIMLKRRSTALIPQAEALPSQSSAVGDAQAAPVASASSTASTRYTLRLTSEPPGVVYEGDVFLGRTPFELAVDSAALSSAPRELVVRGDGFEPHRVELVPSTHDVAAHVVLKAKPSAPAFGRPQPVSAPVSKAAARDAAAKPSVAAPTEAPRGFGSPPESKLRPLDSANPWAR